LDWGTHKLLVNVDSNKFPLELKISTSPSRTRSCLLPGKLFFLDLGYFGETAGDDSFDLMGKVYFRRRDFGSKELENELATSFDRDLVVIGLWKTSGMCLGEVGSGVEKLESTATL
jgi:hypothetical protein